MIALDTETTGIDFYHSCKPFFVTTCDDRNEVTFWEWDVDPLTRQPQIPPDDIRELRDLLTVIGKWGDMAPEVAERHTVILQNPKFDVTALTSIGVVDASNPWPWSQTRDTLRAGHMLASKEPHNLTDMVTSYLGREGIKMEKLELALSIACNQARGIVRRRLPTWKIAKAGLEDMPSTKAGSKKHKKGVESESPSKADMWLPRAICKYAREQLPVYEEYKRTATPARTPVRGMLKKEVLPWWMEYSNPEHPWNTVLRDYSNADSEATIALWIGARHWHGMRRELHDRGLWELYLEMLKVVPVAHAMEKRGITVIGPELDRLEEEFGEDSTDHVAVCQTIASKYKQKCRNPYCNQAPGFSVGPRPICTMCNGKGELGTRLEMPKGGGNNKSLTNFIFNVMKLKPHSYSEKTGNPSLDKETLAHWEATLPENSKELAFILALKQKRKLDVAVSYMRGYRKFWLPYSSQEGNSSKGHVIRTPAMCKCTGSSEGRCPTCDYGLSICNNCGKAESELDDYCTSPFTEKPLYWVLHPNLNPYGSATLRWSCSNPNEQNIAKQEGRNLREAFGPAPGREWARCDAKNIELRLTAYEAVEREMIDLFENPKAAPYFGSYHLLVCHVLHEKLFEQCLTCTKCKLEVQVPASLKYKDSKFCECNPRTRELFIDGRHFKVRYESTWYQWIKNGNFAVQYGAIESSGTADRAYHVIGAQAKIQGRFKAVAILNKRKIAEANKYGYIETMLDRSINTKHGYPLMCTRTEYGKMLETVPLNYYIQGSAMYWMDKAMIRCNAQIDEWRSLTNFDAYIIMQVHDELVFDFPRTATPPMDDIDHSRPDGISLFRKSNLWRYRKLQNLMEQGGNDIGIPTPVSLGFHDVCWARGVEL